MGEIYEASTFPNGKRKSDLYDYFLNYTDFNYTHFEYKGVEDPRNQFELDLAVIRDEERQNIKNCLWRRDLDGQLVVSGLDLRDKGIRVLVTRDGFIVELKVGKLVFINYARGRSSGGHTD